MVQPTDTASSQQIYLQSPLAIFPRFPSLPAEIRVKIRRFAIPIDFQPPPIILKPYCYTNHRLPPRIHRPLPKTSQINQESRHETLKLFRGLQLKISFPDLPGHRGLSLHEHKQRLEVTRPRIIDEEEYKQLGFQYTKTLGKEENRRKRFELEQKRGCGGIRISMFCGSTFGL
jgi:hypothetical protein